MRPECKMVLVVDNRCTIAKIGKIGLNITVLPRECFFYFHPGKSVLSVLAVFGIARGAFRIFMERFMSKVIFPELWLQKLDYVLNYRLNDVPSGTGRPVQMPLSRGFRFYRS